MPTVSDYVTSTGFTRPRFEDFRDLQRADFEADTGLTIDWETDGVLAPLIDINARRADLVSEALEALAVSRTVDGAEGIQFDDVLTVVGLSRKGATRSTVTLTLTGTTGTAVPSGTTLEGGGSDDKARWETTSDVTLSAGTGSVVARCTVDGAIAAAIGEVDYIVTPVEGLTSVTNAAAATVGRAIETDAAARKRRAERFSTGSGSTHAIRTAILAIETVTHASVIENTRNTSVTVEGKSLFPHSILAIIHPSTLTDATKTLIAQAIYDNAPAGCYINGSDVTVSITQADGYTTSVSFDHPDTIQINVVSTVGLESGYALADVSQAVSDAVSGVFTNLTVGEDVLLLDLYQAIGGVAGVRSVTITLENVTAGTAAASADVTIASSQVAALNTNTVS